MINETIPAAVTLNIVAASTLTGGTPKLIGAMVVVPNNSAVSGDLVAVKAVGGAYVLPKNAGTAFATVGALVDWDPTNGKVVPVSATVGNHSLGFVTKAAASADLTVEVSLIAGSVTAH